ncbi:hypothetical protein [Polycladidibacter hongkongensis]|uniref:hypothetical protein n=1 Tax=Polycladidibacter hongkongensis TaxID=1647556 RepID=UPI00083141B7|nr:hypothetical protein [Pseudovibrio hongkongensis]
MAVNPVGPVAAGDEQGTSQAATSLRRSASDVQQAAKSKDFTWDEILDVINPLQHIPGINTLYREITGDEATVRSRIAGSGVWGMLAGGPLGMAGLMAGNVGEMAATGQIDLKDAYNTVTAGSDSKPSTQASAATRKSGPQAAARAVAGAQVPFAGATTPPMGETGWQSAQMNLLPQIQEAGRQVGEAVVYTGKAVGEAAVVVGTGAARAAEQGYSNISNKTRNTLDQIPNHPSQLNIPDGSGLALPDVEKLRKAAGVPDWGDVSNTFATLPDPVDMVTGESARVSRENGADLLQQKLWAAGANNFESVTPRSSGFGGSASGPMNLGHMVQEAPASQLRAQQGAQFNTAGTVDPVLPQVNALARDPRNQLPPELLQDLQSLHQQRMKQGDSNDGS